MEFPLKKTLVKIEAPGIKGFKGDVVKRFLAVDREDLSAEMARTPADSVYWGVLTAKLESATERAKSRLRFVESECDMDIRAKAVTDGEKLTEALIHRKIIHHKKYLAAQETYHDVAEMAGVAKAVSYALHSKKDLLISLGAAERQEMDSDISIKRRKKT